MTTCTCDITGTLMQVGHTHRQKILTVFTNLASAKLRTSRRVEVVLLQCRVHQQLLSRRDTRAPVPEDTLRAWMQGLPQVVWELGGKHEHVARAALQVLRRAYHESSAHVEEFMQGLEPTLAANFGLVIAGAKGRAGRLSAGPLLSMSPDVQVRCPAQKCL
jgi:hypothetical protein